MAGFQTNFVRRTFNSCETAAAARSALGILTAGSTTGTIFYVDSVSGSASGDGLTPATAVTTVALAQALATANKGDIIAFMPKHAQTIIAATEFAPAKAGVTYIGLGEGADRATFTFGTNVTANIPVTAVSCVFRNLLFVSAVDSVVAAMTISVADTVLEDIEIRDTTDIEFVTPILTTSGADRLTIRRIYHNGFITGNACTEVISLIGVDSALIEDCRFFGNYTTAAINMLTTACTKVFIKGCIFREVAATTAKAVVDTQGSSTYTVVDCFDGMLGRNISGNNTYGLASQHGGWFFKSKADPTALASQTLFTFTGAIEFEIWALVTSAIQGQATTIKWQTTVDALAAADLCGTKDINAFVAGSIITCVGTTGTGAVSTDAVGSVGPFATARLMAHCITSGVISVVMGAASSGAITHYIRWRPLTADATVA